MNNDNNMELVLRRYYSFWDAMHALLRMPRVYTFVTGKQAAFALLGYQLLHTTQGKTSPTDHLHLVLGALKATDIQETYKETQLYYSSKCLSEFVCCATGNPELLPYLCQRIRDLTAGLPRMVKACFEALCQIQCGPLVLDSKAAIDTALERAYGRILRTGLLSGRATRTKHLMCNPAAMTGPFSAAYSMLLLASFLQVPLDTRGEVALSSHTKIHLLRVIDKLDLYIDPVVRGIVSKEEEEEEEEGKHLVRVCFSQWTMRYLREKRTNLDARLLPVLPLWDVPAAVLGKGDPLEWLVRVRATYALSLGSAGHGELKWAELFDVFRGTLLANLAIAIDKLEPVRCIPKVVKNGDMPAAETLASDPWCKSMGARHWRALFASDAFPVHTIGYPAPESHSPDVLVRCSDSVVAGFVCKLGTTPITWAALRDEIEKANHLLTTTACEKLCLVLVALTLGEELQSSFRPGDATKLVLPAGKWRYCAAAEKKLDQREPKKGKVEGVLKLTIPPRMELVILGEEGLRSFLGAESVKALQELVRKRRDPKEVTVVDSLQLSLSLLNAKEPKENVGT